MMIVITIISRTTVKTVNKVSVYKQSTLLPHAYHFSDLTEYLFPGLRKKGKDSSEEDDDDDDGEVLLSCLVLDRCWRRRISTSVGNNNDGNDNSN